MIPPQLIDGQHRFNVIIRTPELHSQYFSPTQEKEHSHDPS